MPMCTSVDSSPAIPYVWQLHVHIYTHTYKIYEYVDNRNVGYIQRVENIYKVA